MPALQTEGHIFSRRQGQDLQQPAQQKNVKKKSCFRIINLCTYAPMSAKFIPLSHSGHISALTPSSYGNSRSYPILLIFREKIFKILPFPQTSGFFENPLEQE
jgi:hypothetical protein